MTSNLLDTEELKSALAGTIFAGKIQTFSTIDSTNTHAMQEAQKGAPHGSVYLAEEQTAGRGRSAHVWHSESLAGLYISIILRPQMSPADALWISLASGLAVQAAVENVTALVADIRWPNDLLFGSRKFGGVLTEMNAEATRVRYAVAGIGINVNHGRFPEELKDVATSLRMESDRFTSRQELAIAILQAMHKEIEALMQLENFHRATGSILKRIEKHSSWIRGKRVSVNEAGGYTGVTAGLDSLGFLRVQTEAGMRTVLSGGVREAKVS
jgi:BirA family biotin operon repressor/biotin-[acetyl-CoA-carboxylase] ligase